MHSLLCIALTRFVAAGAEEPCPEVAGYVAVPNGEVLGQLGAMSSYVPSNRVACTFHVGAAFLSKRCYSADTLLHLLIAV